MTNTLRVCEYCGVLPDPVTLERVDGGMVTAVPGPDHAVDCPYFAWPEQPTRVPGPTLLGGAPRRRIARARYL